MFHVFKTKIWSTLYWIHKSNFYPFDSFLGKGGLGSTKFVAFETLAWHNECFFCNICKDSMVGKGFIQVNIHFQELESTRMLFKSRLWETGANFLFRMAKTSFARSAQGRRWWRRLKPNERIRIGLMLKSQNLSFVCLRCVTIYVSASGSDVWMLIMLLLFGCLSCTCVWSCWICSFSFPL